MGTVGNEKCHDGYSGYGKKQSWVQWVGQRATMGTVGRAKSHHGYSG